MRVTVVLAVCAIVGWGVALRGQTNEAPLRASVSHLAWLAGSWSDSATFENPAHDFPKMIRYTKLGDGTLEARVSDGTPAKAEVYVFRRQP